MPSPPPRRLGARVRALRRRAALTQVQLADRLGISPSYLNLIENNKRPLPAEVLIQLAAQFQVDLASFAGDDEGRTVSDLVEVFSDPLFEEHGVTTTELRELLAAAPVAARAVLTLYNAYKSTRESADTLASRLYDGEEVPGLDRARLSSEEVTDLVQRNGNHFPALEEAAEELWARAPLDRNDLYPGLVRTLERDLGVTVRIEPADGARDVLRRFDPERRVLALSELLPTRSRNFQLAHTIGLLTQGPTIDRILAEELLSTPESRSLARVALGNYFAAAVTMPYAPFLEAARQTRYDVDVVARRFRVGFEQAAHRLTSLRRPGAEGVPFHFLRIDVAGNISKRFSASGIRFARFSGTCARWNVFTAFGTPGMIRVQVSRMPDGAAFFCIARTVQKDSFGYHAQHPIMAIGLGCLVEYARELVYADGVDLESANNVVPVGVTCRTCERTDCEQRAVPSARSPLRIDENVRMISPYAPGPGR